jgi:hypothetical protein
MKTKLYYEDSSDLPWIVEQGSVKHRVKGVVIHNKVGITHVNRSADNVTDPRAWIEFIEARLDFSGDYVRIY